MTSNNVNDPAYIPRGFAGRLRKAETAAETILPSIPGFQITVEGTSYDGSSLVKLLKDMRAPYQDVHDARVLLRSKVQVRRGRDKASRALFAHVEKVLVAYFGQTNPAVGQMGLRTPKAAAPLSVEKKLIAAEKRRATRAARGTRGPKARARIVGSVESPIVVQPDATVERPAGSPAAGGSQP